MAEKINLARSSNVKVASLPEPGESYVGKIAVVSGYGWNRITLNKDEHGEEIEEGSSNGDLKFLGVEVLKATACKANLYPSIICGKALQTSNSRYDGVCSGDSGGPLLYGDTIIGIVSSSPIGCDESVNSASYTKVDNYLDFIRGVIDEKPTRDTLIVRCQSNDQQQIFNAITRTRYKVNLTSVRGV